MYDINKFAYKTVCISFKILQARLFWYDGE